MTFEILPKCGEISPNLVTLAETKERRKGRNSFHCNRKTSDWLKFVDWRERGLNGAGAGAGSGKV